MIHTAVLGLAVVMSGAGVPSSSALLAGRPTRETNPPPGFVEMFVAGVVPGPEGNTLVLVSPDEEALLPLGIGLSEALSIHGRLERRPFARPLTHDLLDGVLKELGGELVRVQIDDVKDDVFHSRVFIRSGARTITLDARPSDAVALALGSRAPIFVARTVLDRAALHPGGDTLGKREGGSSAVDEAPAAAPLPRTRPSEAPGVMAL